MLQALAKELAIRRHEFDGELVETIYFGGGTPSLLLPSEIESLLDEINQHYKVAGSPEITLEANPDDLALQSIEGLHTAGINRLSIGVQSFFEEDLVLMNRAHNASQADACLKTAMNYFDNISIDLIYGLPYLSNERWQENISRALDFSLPHISSYALTIEPRTAMSRMISKGQLPDTDDDRTRTQFYILSDRLMAEGYEHYEISNFARSSQYSRNNTAYWQGKKYLGIGPSAHSFDGKSRSWNIRNNLKYIKSLTEGTRPFEWEVLTGDDSYNEYVMTGLRTVWGISLIKIASMFGPARRDYALDQAGKHLQGGKLLLRDDTLLLSREGKFFADGIASDLFMVTLK